MSHQPVRVQVVAGLVVAGMSWCAVASAADTSTLVIRIKEPASPKGQVRVAVHDSEKQWLKTPAYQTVLEAGEPILEWRIPDVPYGEYGVAIYQDENGNGKHDKNALGVPKEPYGFSNNARGKLGPAKWKDAAFSVTAPTTELDIEAE